MKQTHPTNCSQANKKGNARSQRPQCENFCPLCGKMMEKLEPTFWLYAKDSECNLQSRVCVCELELPSAEEWTMNGAIANSPIGKGWRELYMAALYENDKSRLLERIFDAEIALVLRARELFHATDEQFEERQAIETALDDLQALRSTINQTTKHRRNNAAHAA
jgi:hypothetical protein